jgi:hypothetical protein
MERNKNEDLISFFASFSFIKYPMTLPIPAKKITLITTFTIS